MTDEMRRRILSPTWVAVALTATALFGGIASHVISEAAMQGQNERQVEANTQTIGRLEAVNIEQDRAITTLVQKVSDMDMQIKDLKESINLLSRGISAACSQHGTDK